MKLKDHEKMEVNKIYHFDNMEIQRLEDGTLLSHYPKLETMWYEFETDDEWYEKWKDKELVEGNL